MHCSIILQIPFELTFWPASLSLSQTHTRTPFIYLGSSTLLLARSQSHCVLLLPVFWNLHCTCLLSSFILALFLISNIAYSQKLTFLSIKRSAGICWYLKGWLVLHTLCKSLGKNLLNPIPLWCIQWQCSFSHSPFSAVFFPLKFEENTLWASFIWKWRNHLCPFVGLRMTLITGCVATSKTGVVDSRLVSGMPFTFLNFLGDFCNFVSCDCVFDLQDPGSYHIHILCFCHSSYFIWGAAWEKHWLDSIQSALIHHYITYSWLFMFWGGCK